MTKDKKFWQKDISRRKFLKTTGFAAASAAVLTACASPSQKRYLNDQVASSDIKDDHRAYAHAYQAENVTRIPTTCYMCAVNCSAIGVLDNDAGIIKRMEPQPDCPVSGGALCPRGNAGVAQVYDEERLKTPMRKVGPYEWEAISWDEAIDTIYDNLTRIKDEYGPETLMGLNRRGFYNGYVNAFLRAYGTPNGLLGQNSICDSAKRVAQQLQVGGAGCYCDFKNSDYIILMGANQLEAPRYRLAMASDILDAKARGAKLVVVDPRFNYSAAKADEYLAINPGTDGLMLMAMAQVILEEGLEDTDFIANHSYGFDAWSEEIRKAQYSPEEVADEVGIPADTIRRIAIEFASADRGVIDSSSGIAMHQNGTNGHMNLLNVVAMTGNMLSEGGILRRQSAKTASPDWTENNIEADSFCSQAGYVEYSGHPEGGNRNIIPEVILTPTEVPTGPLLDEETAVVNDGNGIKAALIYNTDPVGAQANSEKMKEALGALEFGVVVDIYLNQTAEALPVGSVALPEATYLERDVARTINSYTPAIALNNRVIDPLWESKSMYWIIVKLGQRFGFRDFMAIDPDGEYQAMVDSVTQADQPGDIKLAWSDIEPTGLWQKDGPDGRNYHNYQVFNNEKYYFSFTEETTEDQDIFVQAAQTGLPLYIQSEAPSESYPLRFMAGGKVIWHTQTATRNNKYLMQIFDENVIVKDTNYLVISPEDASSRGLTAEDTAKVSTATGSVEAPVLISKRVPAGYVHMTHGFGHDAPTTSLAHDKGANSSALVSNLRVDPYSNNFTVKEELCQVEKI